ncbi:MAG: DUF1294 domain-containing protein [Candidatus Magasanikbacteria bacterium]|nr:DUF1294 domain-containing protein [Candidatus Magasanikbacteria bacterium]
MRWFLELNLPTQILLLYFLLINLISFFYIGVDKMKAQLNRRRVSEKTLWLSALIGGSLGTLLGMHFFRHKTKKISFQAILAIILAIQIFLILSAV